MHTAIATTTTTTGPNIAIGTGHTQAQAIKDAGRKASGWAGTARIETAEDGILVLSAHGDTIAEAIAEALALDRAMRAR